MDLYEAMKAGSSYEDLLSGFCAELDEASARLEQEKEEAERAKEEAALRDEWLTDCRDCLVEALIDYIEALCDVGKDEEEIEILESSRETIIETLMDFEDEIKRMFEFSKKLERAKEKNPNLETNTPWMDEFLKAFKQF